MLTRYITTIETLNLLPNYIKKAGISRVADLSYLDDSMELYVFSAIRPNAKSITISMGKSLNKEEAKCGALIESIETYFAEEVQPTITSISQNELIAGNKLYVDINMQDYSAIVSNDSKLDWCIGRTLISNHEIYIPYIALTLDSNQIISKIFKLNSDGIASGSNYEEAVIYSFLELVERYATKENLKRQLQNVDNKICSLINTNKINVIYYQYDNIFKLPVIECNILNINPLDNQTIFAGYSCHFSKEVALIKAVSEAIQSKIGVISGSRDDLDDSCYNYYKINRLMGTSEQVDFNSLTSIGMPLKDQYTNIIKLLNLHKMDLAIYSYTADELTIVKTFLINNE